jgi:hypothetical protein
MAAGMRRCTDRLVTRRGARGDSAKLPEFLHKQHFSSRIVQY